MMKPSDSQIPRETVLALLADASELFVKLREAQCQMPEGSTQRIQTGELAHAIDCWCRFMEDTIWLAT